MKIPKSFWLFGRKISVVYDAKMVCHTDYSGLAKYTTNEIVLQPNVDGCVMKYSDIEQAFFHELVHWIFKELNEHELKGNEKLVDTFASLLHQALTTAEYEEEK